MAPATFPSKAITDEIAELPQINLTPTELKALSAEEIAATIVTKLGGSTTLDISNASPGEIAKIQAAGEITIETENGPKKPVINFVNEKNSTREILRKILGDMLEGNATLNIGRRAFKEFVHALFTDPKNHPLLINEWNEFIVDHETTGQVHSPLESHHLGNLGLNTESMGPDDLRDSTIKMINEVMTTVRTEIETVFSSKEAKAHQSAEGLYSKPEMNTPESQSTSIGLALLSNFARGAAYYGARKGQGYLNAYEPRRMAGVMINKQNWQQKFRDLRRTASFLRTQVTVLHGEDAMLEQIADLAEECKKVLGLTDGEIRRYAAYHLMIGSTPSFENSPETDLPNNEIENFMKAKFKELQNS